MPSTQMCPPVESLLQSRVDCRPIYVHAVGDKLRQLFFLKAEGHNDNILANYGNLYLRQ